jgi:hypothetical protein
VNRSRKADVGDVFVSDVSNRTASFFDLYSQGDASEDAIDDFVGAWHDSGDAEDRPLSSFLGVTADEYAVWVMDARSLPLILAARRAHEPLHHAVGRYVVEMQAAENPSDRSAIWSLSHWVGRRGLA